MFEFRDYPFPYKSMLAVCSDLDETPDAATYFAISRYLNTRSHTAIGQGVDLEIGNTLFFDMAPGEFSYWHATDREREHTRALIHSGHIDCLHSFGDLADTRAHAQRALEELDRHDCRIRCWVDHAVAPSNLGTDIMVGYGDDPGRAVYHSDLTIDYGVRYVWVGRVTSCIGQNAPYSATTSLRSERSLASLINTGRDITKYARATFGDDKYAMHRGNRLTRPYTLRDGHRVWEFIRCNPHPHGVSVGDDAQGFGEAVSEAALEHLVRRRGVSIIYTHLGKHVDAEEIFPVQTRKGFERLADAQRRGDILIATTRRLLDYQTARRTVTVEATAKHVALTLPDGVPADGLAWRWQGETPTVTVNEREVTPIRAEEGWRSWLALPWPRLTYPLDG